MRLAHEPRCLRFRHGPRRRAQLTLSVAGVRSYHACGLSLQRKLGKQAGRHPAGGRCESCRSRGRARIIVLTPDDPEDALWRAGAYERFVREDSPEDAVYDSY